MLTKVLKKSAAALERGRTTALVRRVAWLELERMFDQIGLEVACTVESRAFGGFFISHARRQHSDPMLTLVTANSNQMQMQTNFRPLGYSAPVTMENGKGRKVAVESHAALVFSQDSAGSVVVVLYPYTSDGIKLDKTEWAIARYVSPTDISERRVRKHVATFLKFCEASSTHGHFRLRSYLFIRWLNWSDLRRGTGLRAWLFQAIVLLGSAATIIALLVQTLSSGPGVK